MNLAQKIKAARHEKGGGYSQRTFRDELQKAGLKKSYQWVASLESGRVKRLHRDYVPIVAKVLGKPVAYFKEEPLAVASIGAGGQDLKPLVDYLVAELVAVKGRLDRAGL